MRTVILDADGVLVESQTEMLVEAETKFGVKLAYEDWIGFTTLYDLVIKQTGASPKDVAETLFNAEVLNRGVPTPGSREAVKRLKGLGYDVGVATSRPEKDRVYTLKWVAKYFSSLIKPELIFLKPEGKPTFEFKKSVVLECNAVALVEDSGEFMLEAQSDPVFEQVLLGLVDRPWNVNTPFPPEAFSLYRCRLGDYAFDLIGWEQLINRLKEIS